MKNKILLLANRHSRIVQFLLIVIITIPTFSALLNNQYYNMHDDQHIARLYVLDQGIQQGYVYPRWVDTLGFGRGYPLFNFYPPLIYYVAEIFHLVGFSLIWSVKLMVIAGILIGTSGVYLLAKKLLNRTSGFTSAILFSYFGYRALTIYVRGSFAEFFALSILPFVLLALHNLYEKPDFKRSVLFGLSFALLIITHPLIAIPSALFLGIIFLFYVFVTNSKLQFTIQSIIGGTLSLLLSAFFWLPSMVERKFTLVDNILLTELANYKIHYIYFQQFWYSPWGFGGSIDGPFDGQSFQLGKIYIGLSIVSVILFFTYKFVKTEKQKNNLPSIFYLLFFILLIISLFMTLNFSSFIWNNIQYLSYLQFPWRFLTFTTIFISVVGGYSTYFLHTLLKQYHRPQEPDRLTEKVTIAFVIIIFAFAVGINKKYFRPQRYLNVTDKDLTTFEEVGWRVSRSTFEFIPKGVRTMKSDLNTTIPALTENDLPKSSFEILEGDTVIDSGVNKYAHKEFTVNASSDVTFQLNTFNFPGWQAFVDDQSIKINDNNDFKLITVQIPKGEHFLRFEFTHTPIRTLANIISIMSLLGVVAVCAYPQLVSSKRYKAD